MRQISLDAIVSVLPTIKGIGYSVLKASLQFYVASKKRLQDELCDLFSDNCGKISL
ncbi:hypothetical protein N473_18070 [Pseudoalteromonas luteoviolacea CPMOR-1]|uniref:Uncharacterized protein n=1 Tax=Pseudoalteromonas luteoviolacea CPMOR-1 TaxID=1365248 RepID=A0A162BIY1_9GAMM|nr:hypothetical protein N473_18070 [Pseudoalteromonas luteoviolacea CPMOR-1]